MAIIAQNLDSSERKHEFVVNMGATATGATHNLGIVSYNALLKGVNVAAFGLSGAPVYSLRVLRMNAAGLTSIGLGSTLTVQDFGTSGAIGFSLAGPGISLISGDVLFLVTGVANTAITTATVKVVLDALADIRVYQNTVV